jgi:two-component system, NtrC family, sensor kinase
MNSIDLEQKCWTAILDALPDGISVHAHDARIIYANKKICCIYGVEASNLVGVACEEIFHAEHCSCPHNRVLSDGTAAQLEFKRQFDGKTYKLILEPLLGYGGKAEGYVRTMRDITAIRVSRDQLLKAERFATIGQMISGIAHDAGTPLNIVSGYSEYLLMKVSPGADGYRELSTILQQTKRIGVLIKQMLELARPSSGRSEDFGVQSFFGQSINLMGPHLRRAGVKVSFTCSEQLTAYGDAPRLTQALFNLLLNVSGDIGRGGAIELSADEQVGCSNLIRIAIMGRSVEGYPHDFSELYSNLTACTVTEGVVGMGLSLVRQILEESGVEIDIERFEDRASVLIILLSGRAPGTGANPI